MICLKVAYGQVDCGVFDSGMQKYQDSIVYLCWEKIKKNNVLSLTMVDLPAFFFIIWPAIVIFISLGAILVAGTLLILHICRFRFSWNPNLRCNFCFRYILILGAVKNFILFLYL